MSSQLLSLVLAFVLLIRAIPRAHPLRRGHDEWRHMRTCNERPPKHHGRNVCGLPHRVLRLWL